MIKIRDVAYVRLRAPDLDKMEEFLTDFGMVPSARTENALYMRGTDQAHHIHITERGDPKFVGIGFYAASEDDLVTLSQADGSSTVHDIEEPGGGKRVQLTDPDGNLVEVIYGIETAAEMPVSQAQTPNFGTGRNRFGEFVRNEKGPAQVKRLGHVLLVTPQLPALTDFYRGHLGLLPSDEVYDGDKSNLVATFNRVDRGDEYVDHHTLVPVAHPEKAGLQHAAFEVENIDAEMLGHEHLRAKGYRHSWGIGRHFMGSQIFDYWYDPYGFMVEHFIDGDMLNAEAEPGLGSLDTALGVQWGPAVPEDFL